MIDSSAHNVRAPCSGMHPHTASGYAWFNEQMRSPDALMHNSASTQLKKHVSASLSPAFLLVLGQHRLHTAFAPRLPYHLGAKQRAGVSSTVSGSSARAIQFVTPIPNQRFRNAGLLYRSICRLRGRTAPLAPTAVRFHAGRARTIAISLSGWGYSIQWYKQRPYGRIVDIACGWTW